ncbi:hypothetical protein AB0E62_31405 [Streptomyces sp. NPDC038707]|uniref:hypothetical protein n=1 Tax=Streptomyces sp. NPDC038707 TaxID=3154329 RepID=UPI0033C58892
MATLADKASPSGPADFRPYDAYPPAGYWTLILVASSMGALTVVSEYSSGLIRTTTVAVPARGSVVLAKAAVTAAPWTAAGTAASTGSLLVSQAILDGHHAGLPITHPGVFRALVASALLALVCALAGLGFGVLLRHAAGTVITSVFTLVMLPPHVLGEQPLVGEHQTRAGVGRLEPPDPNLGAGARILGLHRHGLWLLDRVHALAADHGRTRRSRREAPRALITDSYRFQVTQGTLFPGQ